MNQTEANAIFKAYYQKRVSLIGAVLPEEKLAVLELMLQELVENGVIPISDNQVAQFNPAHPVFKAILEGEEVNISGEDVGGKAKGLAGASTGAKLAVLAAIFLIPVIFVLIFFQFRSAGEEVVETPEVLLAGVDLEPSPTATVLPTETPIPTPPPVVVVEAIATPVPSQEEISGVRGSVAPSQGDPASIEIAGRSFILATGETQNGVWSPRGAEWLVGTTVRRVIAIPHDDEFETELLELSASEGEGQQINIRLRSGEVVVYQVDSAGWYRRDQIEVLTSDTPSVVVVISKGNERTDEQRFVISGTTLN
ncbi:MAG: hypothetical protein AAF902_02310 [Chloroflexota bacterium]